MIKTTPESKKKNPVRETTKRMCRIAGLVGACQIVSMTCTIWTSSLLETWTISTSLWLKCSFETNQLREWDAVKWNLCSTYFLASCFLRSCCQLWCAYVVFPCTWRGCLSFNPFIKSQCLCFLQLSLYFSFNQYLVWISGRRRNLRRRQSCVEKNSEGMFETLHLWRRYRCDKPSVRRTAPMRIWHFDC